MNKFCLRFITDSCSDAVQAELTGFLNLHLNIKDIYAESIQPYWKEPDRGELICRFSSCQSTESLRAVLADVWEADTADVRRSHIHVPHVLFIWMASADSETL